MSLYVKKLVPGFMILCFVELFVWVTSYTAFPILVTRSIVDFHPELVLLFVICFYILFRQNGLAGEVGGFILIGGIFGFILSYRWNAGYYDGNLLGGLLPFSDADRYYADAQRLILGENFSVFSTRRPLFIGFLAFFLSLTHLDLRFALSLIVGVNAIAAYLAAREVRYSHGSLAASIMLVLEIIFFQTFIGKTLTENLGFSLGALAFAMLWRGARLNSIKLLWAGLFVLTLALSARAGAFFVLPAVLAWGFFYYRANGNRWKIFLFVGILTIILGFAVNSLLVKILGAESGTSNSNYPYVIYSLAVGNKEWHQVMIDFPGIQESQVMGVAIQQIISNPGLFIIGLGRAFSDYFFPSYGSFSFALVVTGYITSSFFNTLLWSSTILGVLFCFKNRAEPLPSLALWLVGGVFVSVPLVPPIISDHMRAYAATIPITASLVAFATSIFHFDNQSSGSFHERIPIAPWLSILSGVLIFFSSLCPILIKNLGKPIEVSTVNCPVGQEWVSIKNSPGSIVKVGSSDHPNELSVIEVPQNDFISSAKHGFSPYTEVTNALSSMVPGQSIVSSINLADKVKKGIDDLNVFLIGNSDQMSSGSINACATPSSSPELRIYRFFNLAPLTSSSRKEVAAQDYFTLPYVLTWIVPGILIGFILVTGLSLLNFRGKSIWIKILQLVSLLGIISSVGYFLHKQAILPIFWEKRTLNSAEFIPIGGNSFGYQMNTKWMSQPRLKQSPAILYENQIKLNFSNAMHQDIIDIGRGRFSLWDGYLYLSSTDNSDPRTNQRAYTLYWPKFLAEQFDIYFLFAMICSIGGILYSISLHGFLIHWHDTWQTILRSDGRKKLKDQGFLMLQAAGAILVLTGIFSAPLGVNFSQDWGWKRIGFLLLGIILFFGKQLGEKISPMIFHLRKPDRE